MRDRFILLLVALLALALPQTGDAQEFSYIRLQELEGRTWLVDSAGKPFFAHGVTHIGTSKNGGDVRKVAQAVSELGFNAYGYGCPPALKGDLPYVEGRNYVPMSTYRTTDGSFRFVDIFDPQEQKKLEQAVERVCLANRKNTNLIGYYWTDLAAWPLKNSTGTNWVEFIRQLPEDSPGQQAYQKFLKQSQHRNPQARDLAFLRLIAREYFRVFGTVNRKHDPDHLIFGDRLTFQTATNVVLEEMLPYVDAIAIQPPFRAGFPKKEFERIHKLTGKPIIVCDFAIRFKDGDKKIRGWMPEENAKVAGERYDEFVRQARATPYIVGVFWCNPIDSKPGFKKTGIKQGLFASGLVARPELNAAIRQLNQSLREKTPSE